MLLIPSGSTLGALRTRKKNWMFLKYIDAFLQKMYLIWKKPLNNSLTRW